MFAYSMATRRTKRRRSRKGGGKFTNVLNFTRSMGLHNMESSSKAAREIINLYAKGHPLEEKGEEVLHSILARHFTKHGKENILKELRKISHEDPSPQNSMQAYMEVMGIIKGY